MQLLIAGVRHTRCSLCDGLGSPQKGGQDMR